MTHVIIMSALLGFAGGVVALSLLCMPILIGLRRVSDEIFNNYTD